MDDALKDEILFKFQIYLADNFEKIQIDTICQAFFIALEGYDIKQKSTELTVINDSDIKTVQMFFVAKDVEGCSKKTIHYYHNEIMKFLTATNKPLKQITTNDIRVHIAKMGLERKVSKITQDNTLRILKSFFSWLLAEDVIEKNPTLRIKRIKADKRQKKAFSEVEVEQLRTAAKNKREKAIIDFMMSTGCRIGEIVGLNRKDIHNDECIVFGKGAKERTVYLNAKAIVSLNEYLKERVDTNEALFVSERKPYNRLNKGGIETAVHELGERANIKNVHPHRFRRTAATMAAKRGMPIEQIKEMLGHARIETTLIYLDMSGDTLKESHKKYVV